MHTGRARICLLGQNCGSAQQSVVQSGSSTVVARATHVEAWPGVARSTKSRGRTRADGGTRRRPPAAQTSRQPAPNAGAATRLRPGAPRSLIAATLACLLLAVGLLAWDLSEPWRSGPPAVSGQIARPLGSAVALVDPRTGTSRDLVRAETNAVVTSVAWSPDRSKLAYVGLPPAARGSDQQRRAVRRSRDRRRPER